MSKVKPFTTGSGDIFKDFGFSDEEAASLSIRASLFRTLQKALKDTSKTQKELAELLGAPQPKISDILNGKMSGFSVERIATYLLKINYNICLDAQPAPPGTVGRVMEKDLLTTQEKELYRSFYSKLSASDKVKAAGLRQVSESTASYKVSSKPTKSRRKK